jgi:hypothetical protein
MKASKGAFHMPKIYIHKEEPRMKIIPKRIRNTFRNLIQDRRGDGFLDLAFKILIVVVIGAAILLILNAAMPSLFSDLIEKISGELTNINVLP